MTSLIIFAAGVAVGALGYRHRGLLRAYLSQILARARR